MLEFESEFESESESEFDFVLEFEKHQGPGGARLTANGTDRGVRGGEHTRASGLALLFGLHQAGRSGTLEVSSGHHWRRVSLVGGRPVWYESSLETETLAHTLVASGLVGQGQMKWLSSKLSPGEDLSEALVASGTVPLDALHAHVVSQVERGYTSALSWDSGTWSFTPCDGLDPDSLDPALLLDIEPLSALWSGVQQQVEMDQILQSVSDPDAGAVCSGKDLDALFETLGVDDTFSGLPRAIGDSTTIDELFREIPDRSGNLVKLLWMLEITGLVQRPQRGTPDPLDGVLEWVHERVEEAPIEEEESVELPLSEDLADALEPIPDETPAAEGETTATDSTPDAAMSSWSAGESSLLPGHPDGGPAEADETPGRWSRSRPKVTQSEAERSPEEIMELLCAAHKHRMGKDYYAFLGVETSASLKEIRLAYKRLARHWKAAATVDGLEPDAIQIARELSTAARRVWQTMSDETLRHAYNRRLAQGSAPLVQPRVRRSVAPSTDVKRPKRAKSEAPWEEAFREAQRYMADGDYSRAVKLLERARRDNPSSPDILAALGWSTWNARGFGAEGQEAAEEYLRLAVAFDARHLKSLEYLARVAVRSDDTDTSRTRLEALLRVVPDHAWGQRAIGKIAKADEDGDSPGGSRLRFWRKKG